MAEADSPSSLAVSAGSMQPKRGNEAESPQQAAAEDSQWLLVKVGSSPHESAAATVALRLEWVAVVAVWQSAEVPVVLEVAAATVARRLALAAEAEALQPAEVPAALEGEVAAVALRPEWVAVVAVWQSAEVAAAWE